MVFAICAGFFLPGRVSAAPLLRLDAEVGSHQLGPYLDFLEDPRGEWTIDDVTAGELAGRFIHNTEPVVTRGFTSSVFWYRFTVAESTGVSSKGSAPSGVDESARSPWLLDIGRAIYFFDLQLYLPRDTVAQEGDSAWRILKINADLAPRPAYVRKNALVLDLPQSRGKPCTLYLRVQTSSSMFIPLTLYTEKAFTEQASNQSFFFGVFYGVMLALLFYNLVLFFSLRDRVYLFYVLFVASTTLYFCGINGLTFDYVFPAWPNVARRVTIVALSFSMFAWPQFARVFMASRDNSPWLDRLLQLCMAAAAVLFFLAFILSFGLLSFLAGVLSKVLIAAVITTGVVCWRRGFRPARTFLLASLALAIGGMTFSMTFSGQMPYSGVTFHAYQIGSAILAMMLSLALAERIRALKAERAELRASQARFQAMAITDPLTQIFNRRYYDTQIQLELTRARELELPLSLLVLDLDNFKTFNDGYGHLAGDAMLTQVAQLIKGCTRDTDSVCRYGGEEFVVILPGTDVERAQEVAERIRQKQESRIFRPRRGLALRSTISIGVAELIPDDEGPEMLFGRADHALYQAKEHGRNRTIVGVVEAGTG